MCIDIRTYLSVHKYYPPPIGWRLAKPIYYLYCLFMDQSFHKPTIKAQCLPILKC